MAFKMNYTKGGFPFSEDKIKKSDRPDRKEVQRSMYNEDDDIGDDTKYSDQEKREGAGASLAFTAPTSNKRGDKKRYKKDKGHGKDKYGNYKDKKKVTTNIFTGKKKMKLDSIDHRDKIKDLEVEAGIGDLSESATASENVDFAFEGPTTNVSRDITGAKRKAVFNPKTGMVEERYQSRSGIYRPTGRSFYDQAYVDASKKEE